MRPVRGIALSSLAAVSTAVVSVASVVSADTHSLSADNPARYGDLAGGPELSRGSDDADAPIRTARYDDTPIAPVDLAGGPARPAGQPAHVVAMASADARPAPDQNAVMLARFIPKDDAPPPGFARPSVYGNPGVRQALAPTDAAVAGFNPKSRVTVSLTNESPLNPGSGLSFGGRDSRQNPAAPQIAPRGRIFDAKRLGVQIDVTPARSKKGRWFAFAATSGDALGFNFGDKGRKAQRWSVEKLAEYGKVQLGLGWRKGPMQISAAATQREIGAYGYSQDDTVFGLSFTISGGKRLPAPKARRGMPRD